MESLEERDFAIPGRLNLAILVVVAPLTWGLLWVGSHASLGWALLAAWGFALFHNTLFSLLHEAVHGVAHRNRRVNETLGTLCAAAFPTSFTMQRIAHLGHHRRNRSDRELYDYRLPHQSRWLRDFWLYAGNLFGLYWFCIPLSNLIFLLAPWFFSSRRFVHGVAKNLGFEAYVEEIAAHSKTRIWLECLLALLYQVALWWALDLDWQGWLLCHWAFALHWSALQYVDHAWSRRHATEGAWNLKVLPLSSAVALNYHFHLVHHRHPEVPWIHLPGLVRAEDQRPTFWAIYFSLWGGTRPAPPMET